MNIDPFNREIFARTVWMEARGEGREGLVACAWSIWNRYRSGRWFTTFKGRSSLALACLFDQQFSAWNAARDDANREAMAVCDYNDADLIRCRAVCDGVIDGTIIDPTDGATHYFYAGMAAWPTWHEKATLTVQVGKHRFYKGVL